MTTVIDFPKDKTKRKKVELTEEEVNELNYKIHLQMKIVVDVLQMNLGWINESPDLTVQLERIDKFLKIVSCKEFISNDTTNITKHWMLRKLSKLDLFLMSIGLKK